MVSYFDALWNKNQAEDRPRVSSTPFRRESNVNRARMQPISVSVSPGWA